jgi:hypothetical protein
MLWRFIPVRNTFLSWFICKFSLSLVGLFHQSGTMYKRACRDIFSNPWFIVSMACLSWYVILQNVHLFSIFYFGISIDIAVARTGVWSFNQSTVQIAIGLFGRLVSIRRYANQYYICFAELISNIWRNVLSSWWCKWAACLWGAVTGKSRIIVIDSATIRYLWQPIIRFFIYIFASVTNYIVHVCVCDSSVASFSMSALQFWRLVAGTSLLSSQTRPLYLANAFLTCSTHDYSQVFISFILLFSVICFS